jgi:translation initiation factor 1
MSTKKREGIVYSTNPDFVFEADSSQQEVTLPPGQQLLYVWLDSKARKGKVVTLIRGFLGTLEDLERLAAELKRSCGTGGSVKDREIIIQGNFREKILNYLADKGYKVKKAGG